MKPIETTEQLRTAIDRGKGGSKVDFSDPAAAPLGTDDEAGGSPNTATQVRLAAQHEIRSTPDTNKNSHTGLGPLWWLVGLSVFLGIGIIASGFWAQSLS